MGWVVHDVHGARLVFTDRTGGVSRAPFDTANLATHVGDDAAAVVENRRRAVARLGAGTGLEAWVPLEQVHGSGVVVAPPVPARLAEADAVVLVHPGPVGAVLVADCAPVAVVGRGAVAAVHAGWRGLVSGVVEAAVARLLGALGPQAAPGSLRAVIGPCIRPCCYAFGERELDRVAERCGPEVRATTAAGGAALDLPAGVRAALRRAGVGEVEELPTCTSCSPDHFSYRRDAVTGRQALLVTLVP